MAANEQEFLAHIKAREGTELNVKNQHISYEDKIKPQGYLTGGYGHLLSKNEIKTYPAGTVIPIAVVDQWLINDTRKAIAAARQQGSEMKDTPTESFIYALANVNFQLGTEWRTKNADGSSGGFKGAWAALKSGDYDNTIANINFNNPGVNENPTGWKIQTKNRVADFELAIRKFKGEVNGIKYVEESAFSLNQLEKNAKKGYGKLKSMVKEYSQYGK
jgi:hypothetical protein